MNTVIKRINSVTGIDSVVYLVSDTKYVSANFLSGSELKHIEKQKEKFKRDLVFFNKINKWIFIQFIKDEKDESKRLDALRKSGSEIVRRLNNNKIKKIVVRDVEGKSAELLALLEGMVLSNYQFLKYKKKDIDQETNSLQQVNVLSSVLEDPELDYLNTMVEATCKCRDIVNEPVSYLTAEKLASEFKTISGEAGIKCEVFNKKKIESLKMGGILAVNRGSIDPPTFTVMEWNPENKVNKKPFVFVGKGVVYDTGGMNLKIHDYMNDMKCDMAGAAAAGTAIYAIAKAKLPVHVISLIPATDNRVGGNAIVPGDVIEMASGNTVEVINTDAEGRLILADALDYAKKFDPQLVIDLATLTGSAQRAIGQSGLVGMQVKAERMFRELIKSSFQVYERIAEFPMWDEYSEEIKSNIADIKNIGGSNAGAITAAKFLEFFTDYPFIHLDIAGPAFLSKKETYRGEGGTGVGVRLLFNFIRKYAEKNNSTN
ncbi:MAG: leucyl aminopeptidase [Bacteroidales bacterium]|nr:leucyl aminopeptidase [Bacteroidales bacterium]MCF8398248.1 leucyl aminopeptidase [Bacteroidales bacterium]